MIDFSNFYQHIAKNQLSHWLEVLPAQLATWQKERQHGQFPKWQKCIEKLPTIEADKIDFTDSVTINTSQSVAPGELKKLESLLGMFTPWRKGPFHVHDIHIDTEWRSDWKWERLREHISPLHNRTILDVGCGSGYHLWRMLGDGAKFAVGIDPSTLFLFQFEIIRHLANNDQRAHLLPLGIQELPALKAFDTVFSMGVLYHRKSPIDHLEQLKNQLRAGGELVLETLVIDGDENQVLVPAGRYGKMNNVWFLPSTAALELWLTKLGFENVRTVDVCDTSVEEQRKTPWMDFESLSDFLDPNDPTKTIEGHPAPKRAVIIANKPFDTEIASQES
ncbi:tRNA 5-methoxyuridine(34)/uridine 5-oxyacetic acid(34) synthase CmoB [Psychrobium sp. 1_MG-2023]|uniref:tRNA 5-methoxyuridine(34)/uridine 5-oxyacetic acid(34) synthase CmoB n=1 Tax=Psychrobium sp. 1_MG-2023 TaxID=3062624 RepID=UPI000C334AF0|nr:tRNA 5-methoxyuridine(34)/uridine 5-oxyacetic acid(34) synthase CmoB [Psychrobium sp. 1_MG-2023]MDP2560244.1 tRNA 5-methoxyuridine(34)/uridine 5-oxyacetic acid(34) synthase CmoB [Psychrobium sp. 1_MG-2023]PKF57054.1 tRNA 5-methoxyuridine(34)/uridine 5-oxyacetic acid(34) synthase CmoB [Alteromonadales bacterium alter-6D02]